MIYQGGGVLPGFEVAKRCNLLFQIERVLCDEWLSNVPSSALSAAIFDVIVENWHPGVDVINFAPLTVDLNKLERSPLTKFVSGGFGQKPTHREWPYPG